MSIDSTAIAAEVTAALAEVGFTATVWRKVTPTGNTGNRWDDPAVDPVDMQVGTLTAIDMGTVTRYDRNTEGALVPRNVRTLMVAAGAGIEPKMGDQVQLSDGKHEITAVSAEQPGGSALFYTLDLAI